MSESIAASIIETLKSFNDFIDLARNLHTPDVEGLSIGRWEDELGRLRMWAANIGAHRIGQSSLDYRLRDASHIRQQVLKLLETIRRRLKDAREILDEVSECDDDSSSDGEDSDQDEPSEIAQMRDSVATMISCLFQMSMLIRNPAKHDVCRELSRSGISAFAPYYINHVREKFPKANEVLVSRLGVAITQRRKYLSYRKRHAAKLKQGLFSGTSDADAVTIGGLSDTIATDPQQRNIEFDDHASDSGVSQTSYAPTLKGGGNIIIPPAPKASHNGEPFECPFCYHIIALDRGHSWAKHVFQDLQPYVCLEADCMTPRKLYTNRREWIYHMRNVHTKSEKQEKRQGETPNGCPLCGIVCVNLGYLEKHVARHMQELALFVLPQDDEDLEDNSIINEVHIASADSQASNESLDEEEKHSTLNDMPELELQWEQAKPEDVATTTDEAGGPHPFPFPYRTRSFETYSATSSGSEEEELEAMKNFATEEHNAKVSQEQMKQKQSEKEKEKEFEGMEKLAIEEHDAKLLEEKIKQIQSEMEREKEYFVKMLAIKRFTVEEQTKQKQKEEAKQKALLERIRSTLPKAGYSEESTEQILKGKGEKEKKSKNTMDSSRPTYIKVHQKYISPDTLNVSDLPWEWDDRDPNYLIIKRWIPEREQEILFEHTRLLREGRQLINASREFKPERAKLLLVRKKSPLENQGPTDYENLIVNSRRDGDFNPFESRQPKQDATSKIFESPQAPKSPVISPRRHSRSSL